jgi:type VI secretion system protein ImpB
MAKNAAGSVAPKERINISYRPANTPSSEKVELPFKVMVLGKFSTETPEDTLIDRQPVNINKANFDDVVKSVNVNLDFMVKNRLVTDGDDLNVNLNIAGMKDFAPDSILENVPELKKTIELRNALKALKGPIGNVPSLRKTLKVLLENDEKRDQLKKELGLS